MHSDEDGQVIVIMVLPWSFDSWTSVQVETGSPVWVGSERLLYNSQVLFHHTIQGFGWELFGCVTVVVEVEAWDTALLDI
jgi:hypothetical protein